jgi:hypothetical protein
MAELGEYLYLSLFAEIINNFHDYVKVVDPLIVLDTGAL